MYVTCLANMVQMSILVALQIEVRSLHTRKQHPSIIYSPKELNGRIVLGTGHLNYYPAYVNLQRFKKAFGLFYRSLIASGSLHSNQQITAPYI